MGLKRYAHHDVVPGEMAPGQGHHLLVAGVVHYFIAGNALGCLGAVFLDVVFEVGQCGVTARYQHLRNPVQCIARMAEKLVLGAYGAAVLAGDVNVFMHGFLPGMLCAKLQYMGGVVVNQGNSVKKVA